MISQEKLASMLDLQNTLNKKIHPEWHLQKFPWTDAIMVEGTEALEHYGWKWWKKQTPDMPQVRIELVDIWHFALSIYLERNVGNVDAATDLLYSHATMWQEQASALEINNGVRGNLRALVSCAATRGAYFDGFAFAALMVGTELSWDQLYTTYVAKNVLNTFRQDNGYKAGTYIKMWHGLEDNVALEQLMNSKPNATPEQLYNKLADIYASVIAQPA